MTTINELRTRAKAIGYKTIHKHGPEYWLIDPDGERRAGGEGLDGMAAVLDQMEAFEAGAVNVISTACGVPMSACDKNGEVALDDPRVVEAVGEEAVNRAIGAGLVPEKPDFDAMSDEELAMHDHRVGNVGMNPDQAKRMTKGYAALRKKARGAEIYEVPNRIRSKSDKLYNLDIQNIQISGGRRPLNEDAVVDLMKSIERIGLQSPPIVRWVEDVVIDGEEWDSAPYLIAGRHRLEAMRRLGHLSITCLVLDLNDVDAELTEIAENLHRAELTALQRDEQIARWIELTTVKSEVDKPVQSAPVSAGGRGNKGGINEASRQLGIESTDAKRAIKVASLSPDAKAAAIEVGLDDNRTALLEAAKQTEPQKQVVVLRELHHQKQTRAERKRDEAECKRLFKNVLDAEVAASATHRAKKTATKKHVVVPGTDGEVHLSEETYANGIELLEAFQKSGLTLDKWKSHITEPLQAELARLTEENATLRAAKDAADARYRELWAFVEEDARNGFMEQIAA